VNHVVEIQEIMAHVEETWLANDGGLTIAASDVLSFGRTAIAAIERGDTTWALQLDPFSAGTGAEGDIISATLEWAGSEMFKGVLNGR